MSMTNTGNIALVYVAPFARPDATAPGGLVIEDQIALTIKASSDEKEYQFNLPITDHTPAMSLLEEWQEQGKLVTVFISTLRAVPFVHDTSKDKDGNPVKKYLRAGKKVAVGKVIVETDAFVVQQAYDVRLAGSVDLDTEAQKAHGDYLKRQAEYKKRSVQARIEKAKEKVKQAQDEAAAKSKKAS
jgi:hypothetical protein